MNVQTRKTRLLFVAALLTTVAFAATACSRPGVSLGPITRVVDVTIDQAQFDQAGSHYTVGLTGPYDRLLDEVTRVEIHEGFVRYAGFKMQPDGSKVPGSFDVSVGAQDGAFQAEVVAVSIPGVTMADPGIVEANRRLAAELGQMSAADQAEVQFLEVTAREGVLNMKIRVRIEL
jgi:hypothetical protein